MAVTRHVPDTSPAREVGLDVSQRPGQGGPDPRPAPEGEYSDPVVFLGRIKPGRAPESRRLVHVFLLTPEARYAAMLTARCGVTLPVDDVHWLPQLAGMPCEHCIVHSLAEHY